MDNTLTNRESDIGGHAKTAGLAIVGLGAFFFLVALIATQLLQLDLRFISGEGMMLFAGAYILVGLQQLWTGRRLERDPDARMS